VDDGGSRVVGRDAELATCDAALRAGACPLVVIFGAAGIGKTTVWEAALARAQAQGFRALVARPAGSESQLAYSALNDLLAGCVDGLLPQLPPARARMLRVALLLEEPGDAPVSSRGVAFALLDALRLLVRRGEAPLVAVDDAQWLDPASATALGFALRRLGGEGGLAALLSCRAEHEAGVDQSLTADRSLRIELGPLSAGALFRIIRERLGRPVPMPLLATIHRACGGNPFYALELARRSLEAGSLAMPESMTALARERLAGLPRPTVEALLEVAALSDPAVGLVDLEPLEPAFATGDLVLAGDRLRFAHPLLRSAVYGIATPLQRRHLHRRLAMRVSGEEHARHLGLASAGPSAEVAAALGEAARSVAARGASQSAVELAEIHVRLAEFALGQGHLAVALEQAGQAVARAGTAGDAGLLVRALSYQSHFQTLAGAPEPGLLARAIRLERELEHPSPYYGPGTMLGLRLMWADRLSQARPHLESQCARAAEAGDEVARAPLLIHLAQLETRAGNWPRAAAYADEAMLLADQIGLRQIQSGARSAAAMVAALTGRPEQARALAEAGLAASRAAKEVTFAAHNLAVLGYLELSLGNPAAADSHLRGLSDLYARMGYGNVGVNPYLPNAIEAALALGERARAESLLSQLERGAGDNPWARAAGLRCRGIIAAVTRRPAAAVTALRQAAQAHEHSQDPFEHARTLLALGNALRRDNQRRAAREALEQARGVFARLGAPVWAEQAARDLASVSGRPPGDTGLTETERRVAELVARGGTNREVAARLVVSERTVATHLTHIYAKLGLRSRTELARTLPAGGPKIRASDDAAQPGAT
jgi:DNA-binding CsgD family transcriptional regulator